MDVSEIVDVDSFQVWLNETNQPREVYVGLAHRAALRVLPMTWEWSAKSQNDEMRALSVLSRSLAASLATLGKEIQEVKLSNTRIESAIAAATQEIGYAASAADDALDACHYAYNVARSDTEKADAAFFSVLDSTKSFSYFDGGTSIAAAEAIVCAALRRDCENAQNGAEWLSQPLWPTTPANIQTLWSSLSKSLHEEAARSNEATARGTADALDWTFFVEWYENALHGKPQNQKLIEDIVLSSEIDWEAPSQALGVINRMWREARITQTPNAERLVENPETKKIYSEPDSEIPDDHLQDAVDMLSDAVHAFGSFDGGNAPYAGLSYEFELLADTLARYNENSVRFYDRTRQVHNSIHRRAKLGDCPEIEKDPKLADFCGQLGQVQEDLKAFDPKVKAKIKGRANSAVEDVSEELEQQVTQADAALEPIFEGDLGFSFKEDAQLFCDPTTPLTTKGDALYRISSRIFRIVHGAYHPAKTVTKDAVFWSASISAIAVSPPVQTLYHALMRLL